MLARFALWGAVAEDSYKKQGIPKEAAYDVEKASAAVEGLLTAGTGNA